MDSVHIVRMLHVHYLYGRKLHMCSCQMYIMVSCTAVSISMSQNQT